jgi:hypothetical protein
MQGIGGFADYYGQTQVDALGLIVTIVLACLVFWLPRRYALLPLLVAATSLPMAQRLVIVGVDFTLLRLLLLAYVARILFRREWVELTWNRLDSAIILWVVSGTTIMTIHYGSADALVNRLGWAFDIIIVYFSSRILIRQWDDIRAFGKGAALISIPIGGAFVYEYFMLHNIFSVFHGVGATPWGGWGRVRSAGPFAHPIIAGVFWAALLPLIWALWMGEARSRMLTAAGTAGAFAIILTTSSSTSILSLLAAAFGLALFLVRRLRTLIWIGFASVILLLHFFIMKAPVWHLMSRFDFTGGSTGYHRFAVFDAFVHHFSDWYLTGSANARDWRWEMQDVTNQFVAEGIAGGFLTLSMFVLVLVWGFANVGRELRRISSQSGPRDSATEWHVWLVGVALFIHTVTFWGLTYFSQLLVLLYVQFGIAGAVGAGLAPGGQGGHRTKIASTITRPGLRTPRDVRLGFGNDPRGSEG